MVAIERRLPLDRLDAAVEIVGVVNHPRAKPGRYRRDDPVQFEGMQ